MPTVVSMLRGVNLGPHNRMKMDALRALYESLGLRDPRTYVQSGNVVFRTRERDMPALSALIEKGIARAFDIRSAVILRNTAEMRDVVARNPFAKRPDIEPGKLVVTFLAADPGPEACAKVQAIPCEPEEVRIDGRELYIYYPNGQARPKLSFAAVERALKTPGTGRNWNSVTRLLAMAEELDAL